MATGDKNEGKTMDGLRVERDAKGGKSAEIAWFNASFALILATFLVCKSIYQLCLKLRSGLAVYSSNYLVIRRGRLIYGRVDAGVALRAGKQFLFSSRPQCSAVLVG